MDNISFTSTIKIVNTSEFNKLAQKCGKQHSVDYPWTIKETVKAANVYTRQIADCSACVITNGQEAVMMHLTPDNQTNHAFSVVLQTLRNLIDLKNPNLQAVLIGSKNTTKSQDIFIKFQKLLEELNIPYSIFKNSKTPINIGYSSTNDEVLLSNIKIEQQLKKNLPPKEILKNTFENFNINQCDEINN